MNKETRAFIWGLLIVFICGYGLVVCMHEVNEGSFGGWFDWARLIFCCLAVINGAEKINETT